MKSDRRRTLVKALILLALAGIAIGLVEISPIKAHLGPDRFQGIIGKAGLMGPALLVIFCAVGTCLFIPVTVFVAAGAALFGPYMAFACVCPGALAGALIAYLTARKLGRQFVYSFIGDRLRNYDGLLERNGFKTVLFLRLMFTPFAPLNYAAGLTKVRFWDYFFATALGEAVTVSVFIFFIGMIREIYLSGDWSQLFSSKMALALGFLIALALIAKWVQKKCERGSAPVPGNPSVSIRQM